MKYCFILILLIFILPTSASAQKVIIIPQKERDLDIYKNFDKRVYNLELKDLRKSTDSLNIRVYMGNMVVQLNVNDSISGSTTFKIRKVTDSSELLISKNIKIDSNIAKSLLKKLNYLDIQKLPDNDYWGMDGTVYIFEIATPSKYRLFSYWSPSILDSNEDTKRAAEILSTISRDLDFEIGYKNFMKELPSGFYSFGMLIYKKVDRLLPETHFKSSAYAKVEKLMRKKLGISEKTDPLEMPDLIINDSKCLIEDLNLFEQNDIKKIDVQNQKQVREINRYPKNSHVNAKVVLVLNKSIEVKRRLVF